MTAHKSVYSIIERLEYELSVIQTMGYVDYFLIVWDYIQLCRSVNGHPGRSGTRFGGGQCGFILPWTLPILTR